MIKYFISTGCSFTEVPFPELNGKERVNLSEYEGKSLSWPVHVTNHLNCIPIYKGKGASGNGIISRTTIYEVNSALKIYKPEEILVGIMWSGSYRQEIYTTEPTLSYHKVDNGTSNGTNPANVGGKNNFYKVMPYWNDEYSKWYYKCIYNDVGAYIQTIEHILRVQWMLKNYNIKYFMTTYSPYVFPEHVDMLCHPDIKYLYDMIDFTNFLDVDNEYEWCKRFQPEETWDDIPVLKKHPGTIQHKAFAEQVIVPHLEKKGYISKVNK